MKIMKNLIALVAIPFTCIQIYLVLTVRSPHTGGLQIMLISIVFVALGLAVTVLSSRTLSAKNKLWLCGFGIFWMAIMVFSGWNER